MSDHLATIQALQEENARLHQRIAELEARYVFQSVTHPVSATPQATLSEPSNGAHQRPPQPVAATIDNNDDMCYRLLAEHATDLISHHSLDGTYRYVSPSCQLLLGYTPQELLEYSPYALFHPDDIPAIQQSHQTIRDTPTISTISYRMRHKEGHYIWFETTSKVIRDPHNSVSDEIIAITRDISQRKQLEAEREHSLALMKATVESATGAVVVTSLEGKVIIYNQRFVQLWQLPPDWEQADDNNALPCQILNQIREPEQFMQRAEELLTAPEHDAHDIIPLTSGTILERYSTPYRVSGGIAGRLWSYRDITRRIQHEEALRASQMQLQAIFDNVAVGLGLIDTSWRYIRINERWADMLGYTPDEIYRGTVLDVTHPDDVSISSAYQQRLARGDIDSYRLEKRFVRKDGSHFWGDTRVRLIRDEQGGPTLIIGTVADITAQKQAEHALRESEQRFRLLVENARDVVYRIVLYPSLAFDYISPAIEDLTGYAPDECYADFDILYEVIHPDGWHQIERLKRRELSNNRLHELRFRRKDGSLIWTEHRRTIIYDEAGQPVAVEGRIADITERVEGEEALRQSEARHRLLSEQHARLYEAERRRVQFLEVLRATMTEISAELDIDSLLRTIVQHAMALLRTTSGELSLYNDEQQHLYTVVCLGLRNDYTGTCIAMGKGVTGQVALTRAPLVIPDYQQWTERLTQYQQEDTQTVLAVPLLAGEQLVGVISVGDANLRRVFEAEDVELLTLFAQQATIAIQNAHLFTEVQHLATTDSLTGLFNRRQFFELAQREFQRSVSYGRPLVLMMFDIDHFKQINDSYGHMVGDQVLQVVARHCQQVLRPVDIIGRYGGEEFILLLPETDLSGGQTVAERLRAMLEQVDIETTSGIVHTTASIGLVAYTGVGITTLEQLIDYADQSLYAAKQQGRNRVVTWDVQLVLPEVSPRALKLSHQRTETLLRLASRLNAHHDLNRVLQIVCDEAARLLNVPYAVIQLYDREHDNLPFAAVAGAPDLPLNPSVPTPRPDYEALLSRHGDIIVVPDLQTTSVPPNARLHQKFDMRTLVSVPIRYRGNLIGTLNIATKGKERAFRPDELDLLQGLANQAALAIINARLFSDLIQAYDETLEGWSHALELRDHETEGHSQRVVSLTICLSKLLGIDPAEYDHIRRGALLHDIGKMGIPDAVLLKAGPLNDEEWALMRQHPTYAYHLLNPIEFLRPAVDIPYCHHERWDGSGYPRGLRSTDIPLAARIFAVVDVWDALRSDRPYRAAWSAAAARDYIAAQAGTHFDPRVVQVFLRLVEEER